MNSKVNWCRQGINKLMYNNNNVYYLNTSFCLLSGTGSHFHNKYCLESIIHLFLTAAGSVSQRFLRRWRPKGLWPNPYFLLFDVAIKTVCLFTLIGCQVYFLVNMLLGVWLVCMDCRKITRVVRWHSDLVVVSMVLIITRVHNNVLFEMLV